MFVSALLVGQCLETKLENEEHLFELLLYANKGMLMCVVDVLGVIKSTLFDVKINDKFVKPVYHELRRYSKRKLEFIDKEVDKKNFHGCDRALAW